jgi:solute:Na+ symporter, SSS family
VVIMLVALLFAIIFPKALVDLLLIGYDGVTQFFPAVVLGLFWKRIHAAAVWTGLAVGIGLVAVLCWNGLDPLWGLNAGFIALASNLAVTWLVSMAVADKHSRVGQTAGGNL